MPARHRPFIWNPRDLLRIQHPGRMILALALLAAGYLGNRVDLTILYGTNFLLGSVATMVACLWYGWPFAILVAAVSSSVTLDLWNHPYFVIISMGEALFVSLVMRRFWHNIVAAATFYWLLPGAVLFWFCYYGVMHVPADQALLLWLKQAVNGIFNAIVAGGLILLAALFRKGDTKVPIQQAYFNTLVSIVFIPVFGLVCLNSHSRMESMTNKIKGDAQDKGRHVANFLEVWRTQNLSAVSALANIAGGERDWTSASLQRDTAIVHKTFPIFETMYIADARATTVAFDPQRNASGEVLIGLNFADRQYYREVKETLKPLVGDVIQGRGGVDVPIVCFVAPILTEDDNFRGYALGSVDVRRLSQTLQTLISDSSFKIMVSDTRGSVVASTSEEVSPLDEIGSYLKQNAKWITDDTYLKATMDPLTTPSYSQWSSAILGRSIQVPSLGWTIHVEVPFAHYIRESQAWFIDSFTQLLAIVLGAIILSIMIVSWVAHPIAELAHSTSTFAKNVIKAPSIRWPRSRFVEITTLIDNFRRMTEILEERFQELGREVQERKATEDKLKIAMNQVNAANIAKSEFLANMSHEIRTPLGAVIGYAELIASQDQLSIEQQKSIDAILRNGRQLAHLVDDILDLSKIEAGHMPIHPDWISIEDLIAGSIEVFKHLAEEKQISLVISSQGPMPPRIHVDPLRIKQIFFNIVGNAVKFTDHGTVSITFEMLPIEACPSAWTLKASVKDSGIGIDSLSQAQLFRPFVQADASYSRKFKGTGLGLSLSRLIAQALCGDVKLVSSTKGQGSHFEIAVKVGTDPRHQWLPSLEAARSSAKKATPEIPQGRDLEQYEILLVEDSADNRVLIKSMLGRYGAHVTCASGGAEGVTLAKSRSWDVILMDMQMPGMDGYEATRLLRASGYTGLIMALTAHALPEERRHCLSIGCNDHVTKPINWGHLVHRILHLMRSGGAPEA